MSQLFLLIYKKCSVRDQVHICINELIQNQFMYAVP